MLCRSCLCYRGKNRHSDDTISAEWTLQHSNAKDDVLNCQLKISQEQMNPVQAHYQRVVRSLQTDFDLHHSLAVLHRNPCRLPENLHRLVEGASHQSSHVHG